MGLASEGIERLTIDIVREDRRGWCVVVTIYEADGVAILSHPDVATEAKAFALARSTLADFQPVNVLN